MSRDDSDAAVVEILRASLQGQYHAALAMLRQAIEACPDDMWIRDDRDGGNPIWRVAYHALYYTDLYLQRDEDSFRPWELHLTGLQDLDDVPAPEHLRHLLELPHRPQWTGVPYTREQVLTYWWICDGMVDGAIAATDLEATETGFSWHDPQRPKVEQHIDSIRHVQHHVGQLATRVRAESGASVDWVGSRGAAQRAPATVAPHSPTTPALQEVEDPGV